MGAGRQELPVLGCHCVYRCTARSPSRSFRSPTLSSEPAAAAPATRGLPRLRSRLPFIFHPSPADAAPRNRGNISSSSGWRSSISSSGWRSSISSSGWRSSSSSSSSSSRRNGSGQRSSRTSALLYSLGILSSWDRNTPLSPSSAPRSAPHSVEEARTSQPSTPGNVVTWDLPALLLTASRSVDSPLRLRSGSGPLTSTGDVLLSLEEGGGGGGGAGSGKGAAACGGLQGSGTPGEPLPPLRREESVPWSEGCTLEAWLAAQVRQRGCVALMPPNFMQTSTLVAVAPTALVSSRLRYLDLRAIPNAHLVPLTSRFGRCPSLNTRRSLQRRAVLQGWWRPLPCAVCVCAWVCTRV